MLRNSPPHTLPLIQFIQRSWDYVPSDVPWPLATSDIGTIAILARRLGMEWIELDPANEHLRAEGRIGVITSTSVRGRGLMLEYKSFPGEVVLDMVSAVPRPFCCTLS